jgi:uncharacterized membrane protein YhaH (DUF805 family)
MNLVNLLFSYQGRINRAKFWLSVLIYIIATFIMMALFFIPLFGWIAAAVGYVAMMVSGIFVGIKRLHDRDQSGWWLIVFYVVPAVLSGIGTYHGADADEPTSLGMLLSLISLAISLWGFVVLGCLRGTIGPNQYGADPIAPAPATH